MGEKQTIKTVHPISTARSVFSYIMEHGFSLGEADHFTSKKLKPSKLPTLVFPPSSTAADTSSATATKLRVAKVLLLTNALVWLAVVVAYFLTNKGC